MGRRALIAAIAGTAAFAAAVSCASGSGPKAAQRPDGGTPCQVGDGTCTAGTRCVNRNCVPTCTNGAACPGGSYCEGDAGPEDVCAPNTPITCAADTDCPSPQACSSGLCTGAELLFDGGFGGCYLNAAPNDGCASDALCVVLGTTSGTSRVSCLGFPACGADGTCPPSFEGSVCNDGQLPDGGQLLPGKQRICLGTYCMKQGDCGTTSECFRATRAVPYGRCDFGVPGDPCFVDASCFNSTKCIGADGGLDDGGVPGHCQ